MTKEKRELLAKRAALYQQMKGVIDLAGTESRELNADEQTTIASIEAEFDKFDSRLALLDKLESRENTALGTVSDADNDPPPADSQRRGANPAAEIRSIVEGFASGGMASLGDGEFDRAQRDIFHRYLKGGMPAIRSDERAMMQVDMEGRALAMDQDIYGGYLVLPQQFIQTLIQAVDDITFVRQFATIHQVATAASLGMPSLDNDPADPTWTAEISTGTEDSSMSFGKRELYPHPLAQLIKISEKLLRASTMNVENKVRERLSYKSGIVTENAYLNGNGNNQPLGMMVASDDGIPTSRDVSTDNTTTGVTTDGLIEAKWSLKVQYWARARWLFHRDAVKQIRKLKDGEGQYIWLPGISTDQGDRILNLPYHMSEYMPNTFTTGLYVGLIGDLSFYHIADALDMRIQRLNELYAATNQVGFISRLESDGMPVLAEAFARVKLA